MKRRSFVPMYLTNFFGVINDNFLKTVASFVAIGWLTDPQDASLAMGVVAAALVLPYVLLSPLADRLTFVTSKVRIWRIAKWAELPIVALGAVGFWQESMTVVVLSIVLMGVQSALYSPAKYALVRDVGGEERISVGMGGMEGVAFLGVLMGTIAGSLVADLEAARPYVKYAGLFGFAVLGLVASYGVRAEEVRSRELHAINPIRYFRRARRMARRYPGLNGVIGTLSVFWWAAAMLQMGLLVYGQQAMGLDATHTGALLAAAAVGIVVGQVVAGYVDRRCYLLALSPFTGLLAAGILAVMFFVPLSPRAFAVALTALAVDFGFFKLPFDAEIQKVVKGPRLNTMLAYFNQVSFVFMLVASGVYALVCKFFGIRSFLLVIALGMAAASVLFLFNYRRVFCRVGRWVLSRRYRVKVRGEAALEAAQAQGAAMLFLPNHPAMVDPMLVTGELWRYDVSPLCDEAFFESGWLVAHVLRLLDAVKVPDLRKHRSAAGAQVARGLTGVVTEALREGRNVVFYPSGHIWANAPVEELGNRQLAHNVCGELPPRVRVMAVRTLGLWGSCWSRKGRRSSPPLGLALAKSLLLWPVALVVPWWRRSVTMEIEDVTDRVREWSQLSRQEFNRQLEAWYNAQPVSGD